MLTFFSFKGVFFDHQWSLIYDYLHKGLPSSEQRVCEVAKILKSKCKLSEW
jgi:hypothetical protein